MTNDTVARHAFDDRLIEQIFFAAVHESQFGPSATSDNVRHKSALRETSDMRPGRVISETS